MEVYPVACKVGRGVQDLCLDSFAWTVLRFATEHERVAGSWAGIEKGSVDFRVTAQPLHAEAAVATRGVGGDGTVQDVVAGEAAVAVSGEILSDVAVRGAAALAVCPRHDVYRSSVRFGGRRVNDDRRCQCTE